MTSPLSLVVIPADEANPIESIILEVSGDENFEGSLEERVSSLLGSSTKLAPLLLPASTDEPGLYVYSFVPTSGNQLAKNVRATRLAMACGNLGTRFHGDVLLFRSSGGGRGDTDLTVNEIYGAACVSPDLRPEIQSKLNDGAVYNAPEWLATASQQNYHDSATISRLASAMNPSRKPDADADESSDDESSTGSETEALAESKCETHDCGGDEGKHFIARTPLCLHCRGPSDALCPECEGAYFCPEPRECRSLGWSHDCLCATWKLYTNRRRQLSTFPLDDWYLRLSGRDCQLSEEPYQLFLTQEVGIELDQSSWWRTELDGWSGGESESAQTVDATVRRSYQEGFFPVVYTPPDGPVSSKDLERLDTMPRNACGLLRLVSWGDYYALRDIPLSSPVALLLTFPLTIYHAIVKFGEVPLTVSKMLKRPLRIHVVGVEKEMNFLDIFREVGYLLPGDVSVELTFVVRRDMLPPKSRDRGATREPFLTLDLVSNLTLLVVSGTYGDDLDPNFDCGSGPPDMIIGLNAGLFAYESWRSVIVYLQQQGGVVGVFTDYNEHSGMNCASLGGSKSRKSLCVNPFRQPRAMPVMSMNLPQFSNGFMYAYNIQELE